MAHPCHQGVMVQKVHLYITKMIQKYTGFNRIARDDRIHASMQAAWKCIYLYKAYH